MKNLYLEAVKETERVIELAEVGYRQKVLNLANCLKTARLDEVDDLLEDFNVYAKAMKNLRDKREAVQDLYRAEVEKGIEKAKEKELKEAFGDRWEELNKEGEVVVCG